MKPRQLGRHTSQHLRKAVTGKSSNRQIVAFERLTRYNLSIQVRLETFEVSLARVLTVGRKQLMDNNTPCVDNSPESLRHFIFK